MDDIEVIGMLEAFGNMKALPHLRVHVGILFITAVANGTQRCGGHGVTGSKQRDIYAEADQLFG